MHSCDAAPAPCREVMRCNVTKQASKGFHDILVFPHSISDSRVVARCLLSSQPSVLREAMAESNSATREDYEELRRLGGSHICMSTYMCI